MRVLAATLLFCLWAGGGAAQCRQALALGLDVSGSVDSTEYRLQLDGVAGALTHPEVMDALMAMPGNPVRLAVYEWSGPFDAVLLLDWTTLATPGDVTAVAERLRAVQRRRGSHATALGSALEFGLALLNEPNGCWRRTLDISGDGKANVGPRPQDVRAALPGWMTVNALVIGADSRGDLDRRQVEIGELVAYFRAYVLHGPDAFTEVALGFDAYEAAMVRKLKRELQGMVIGATPGLPLR